MTNDTCSVTEKKSTAYKDLGLHGVFLGRRWLTNVIARRHDDPVAGPLFVCKTKSH